MKEIVQKYINAYNESNVEAMISLIHPDFIFESKTNGFVSFTTKGKHSFRQICNIAKNNYKHRKQVIEGFKEFENKIEVNLYFKATLAIDIEEMGKKDEQVSFETKTIFELKDGLIYKITNLD